MKECMLKESLPLHAKIAQMTAPFATIQAQLLNIAKSVNGDTI